MEFWFSELHSPHVKFDIRVEKQLFSGESDYQRIDVFQSPEFGKFLTLNGSVILLNELHTYGSVRNLRDRRHDLYELRVKK